MQKRSQQLCKSLGLKQEEMAMLLGITRAQWSMFESRKRSLPTAAMQIYAELLAYLNAAESTGKRPPESLPTDMEKNSLKRLLLGNQVQQMKVARKLQAIVKKHDATIKLVHVVEYFAANSEKKEIVERSKFNPLVTKASIPTKTKGLLELVKLQVKSEVLKFEEELLKKRLAEC
jgi:transcriptional regulator with XRE-family HTH domain